MTVRIFVWLALTVAVVDAHGAWVVQYEEEERETRVRQAYPEGARALIIGNSNYAATRKSGRGWSDLPGVERDVDRMTGLFRSLGIVPRIERDLDRAAMLAVLEEFAREGRDRVEADSQSLAILYYAGHGDVLRDVGYLVPVDAPNPRDGEEAFLAQAVHVVDAVQKVALTVRDRDVLFLLDSCFAGISLQLTPLGPVRLRESAQRPRVAQVIAAASNRQEARDDGGFTDRLAAGLTGLADLNGDGWITGSELGGYVRGHLAERYGGVQTPVFGNLVIPSVLGQGEVFLVPLGDGSMQLLPGPPIAETRIGASFRDCEYCPEMVIVPARTGATGSTQVLGSFSIGKFEVSYEEWDRCFAAGHCSRWLPDRGHSRGRMPATGMNYTEASEYARWLSLSTGGIYRLPEASEWQWVADLASMDGAIGSPTGGSLPVVCRNCGTLWDGRPAPVGSLRPNSLGIYDLLGNVWEFTSTCAAVEAGHTCDRRLVKGGGYSTSRKAISPGLEGFVTKQRREAHLGFRVVRSL